MLTPSGAPAPVAGRRAERGPPAPDAPPGDPAVAGGHFHIQRILKAFEELLNRSHKALSNVRALSNSRFDFSHSFTLPNLTRQGLWCQIPARRK